MRDYQLDGLNWMVNLFQNGVNGILADEMGLGKTLQSISFIGYIVHVKKNTKFQLIICPLSTLENWKNEISKWCPSLKTICLYGNIYQRKHVFKELNKNKYDVVLTTYEHVISDIKHLSKIDWSVIILDECQKVKNPRTKIYKSIYKIKSESRLFLTGTPVNNNLQELWVLLNLLLPNVFKLITDGNVYNIHSFLNSEEKISRFKGIIQHFILRRLKIDVAKNLIPKKEIKIYVSMTKLQKEIIRKILNKDITYNFSGYKSNVNLTNIFMELRKCTNHPFLVKGVEEPPFMTDERIVECSCKMQVLDKLLNRFKEQNSKVLIFSQFTIMLDIIDDFLYWKGYEYCRLDGNIRKDRRDEQISNFNSEGSSKFIFLLSTRAGGLGINLVSADVVIIYDSDWNPQTDKQAIDRSHRIGQTKQVKVFRFITENSVEERIEEIREIKLKLGDSIVDNECFKGKFL